MITRGEILKRRREQLGISFLKLSWKTKINIYTLWRYERGCYIKTSHFNSLCSALNVAPDFLGKGNEAYLINDVYREAISALGREIYAGGWEFEEITLGHLELYASDDVVRKLIGGSETRMIDKILNGEVSMENTFYNILCGVDCFLWKNYHAGYNKENSRYKVIYFLG